MIVGGGKTETFKLSGLMGSFLTDFDSQAGAASGNSSNPVAAPTLDTDLANLTHGHFRQVRSTTPR